MSDTFNNNSDKQKLSWYTVEMAINEETDWLKNNILPHHQNHNPLNYPDDYFYRLIAILIVSGKVKITEYQIDIPKETLIDIKSEKMHGAEWHNAVILYLSRYLSGRNYVVNGHEPPLYYGYADFMIENAGKKIYFEIDTINTFKLWLNLLKMENIKIINIQQNKIIKLEI